MTPGAIPLANDLASGGATTNPDLAVRWTFAIAVFLGIIHPLSPILHRRVGGRERLVASLGGGMAASGVFLQLIPEAENAHEPLEDQVEAIMLIGFIVLYSLERLVALRSTNREHGSVWDAVFHFGSKVLYKGLIVYTIRRICRVAPYSLSFSVWRWAFVCSIPTTIWRTSISAKFARGAAICWRLHSFPDG